MVEVGDAMLDDLSTFLKSKAAWPTISVLGVLAASIATGAYVIGKDLGEKELSVYRVGSKVDFEGAAKSATKSADDLRTATEQFSLLLRTSKGYEEMKGALAAAEQQRTSLEEELRTLNEKARATSVRLEAMSKELAIVTEAHQKLTAGYDLELKDNAQLRADKSRLTTSLSNSSAEVERLKKALESYTQSNSTYLLKVGQAATTVGRFNVGLVSVTTGKATINIDGNRAEVYVGDRIKLQSFNGAICEVWVRELGLFDGKVGVTCELQ